MQILINDVIFLTIMKKGLVVGVVFLLMMLPIVSGYHVIRKDNSVITKDNRTVTPLVLSPTTSHDRITNQFVKLRHYIIGTSVFDQKDYTEKWMRSAFDNGEFMAGIFVKELGVFGSYFSLNSRVRSTVEGPESVESQVITASGDAVRQRVNRIGVQQYLDNLPPCGALCQRGFRESLGRCDHLFAARFLGYMEKSEEYFKSRSDVNAYSMDLPIEPVVRTSPNALSSWIYIKRKRVPESFITYSHSSLDQDTADLISQLNYMNSVFPEISSVACMHGMEDVYAILRGDYIAIQSLTFKDSGDVLREFDALFLSLRNAYGRMDSMVDAEGYEARRLELEDQLYQLS